MLWSNLPIYSVWHGNVHVAALDLRSQIYIKCNQAKSSARSTWSPTFVAQTLEEAEGNLITTHTTPQHCTDEHLHGQMEAATTKITKPWHAAASLHQLSRWLPLSDVSAGVEVVGSALRGVMSLPLTVVLTGQRHSSLQGVPTASQYVSLLVGCQHAMRCRSP